MCRWRPTLTQLHDQGMSFENLRPDWPDLPLTDPTLACDVVDLFLRVSDRMKRSALLLLCDEEDRLMQPVTVDGIDWHMVASERALLFGFLSHLGVPGLVLAISGPRPIDPGVAERWRDTAEHELARLGVRFLGFYTADPNSVWEPAAPAA